MAFTLTLILRSLARGLCNPCVCEVPLEAILSQLLHFFLSHLTPFILIHLFITTTSLVT